MLSIAPLITITNSSCCFGQWQLEWNIFLLLNYLGNIVYVTINSIAHVIILLYTRRSGAQHHLLHLVSSGTQKHLNTSITLDGAGFVLIPLQKTPLTLYVSGNGVNIECGTDVPEMEVVSLVVLWPIMPFLGLEITHIICRST